MPMRLLAIETSTEYCSIALSMGATTFLRREHVGQRHSERVLPMIDELLRETAMRPALLDAIAFGAGPGSFTGLRIACGVAQGLAFAHELPIAAVSCLEALAEADGAPLVYACLDARMGELYVAAYAREPDGWREVIAPQLCRPETAPQPGPGVWRGVGNGFGRHASALNERLGLAEIDVSQRPDAAAIAALGLRAVARGRCTSAELAVPLYLRDKVALTTAERA